MKEKVRYGHATHVGRRPNNEDAVHLAPELGLFAVADGMGGYEGGEIASRMAVETLHEHLAATARRDAATLIQAVRSAHTTVRKARTGTLASMGCTLEALLVVGHRVLVAHVGDSRVYRLRGGALQQLTRDHSLGAQLMASGCELSGYWAHVITRAVGMDGQIRPDLWSDDARPGDTFLLSTDGLHDTVKDADLQAVLSSTTSPASAADHLVERAYRSGARDNISALVVTV